MNRVGISLFLVIICTEISSQSLQGDITNQINNSNGTEKILSRRRRYLVFPTGSSLQLVYCLTVPSVGMGQIFTLGHTAALAWELPDKPDMLFDKFKKHTTTEAPETTTLPPLHHDHDADHGQDYDYGAMPYDHPPQRIDIPQKYSPGRWKYQSGKYPGPVNSVKTYYNPFLINKPSVYGYSPINTVSNPGAYSTLQRNSISSGGSSRRKYISGGNRLPSKVYYQNSLYNQPKPISTYLHPVYHQVHRRTRRDLYGKIEKLFTALSKDGKACLLKAICEVSQVAQRRGTFMEEIIKVIFRVKPHDAYPDEDEYDTAANKSHNCTELYPSCNGSIWSSMLGY